MAEQVIELNPGESKLVSFEAVPSVAKTYQVTVNGLSGSFKALPAAPPIVVSGFHYVYKGAYTWQLLGTMIHGESITHIGFKFTNPSGASVPGVSVKMRLVNQHTYEGVSLPDTELVAAVDQYKAVIAQPFTMPPDYKEVWYPWSPADNGGDYMMLAGNYHLDHSAYTGRPGDIINFAVWRGGPAAPPLTIEQCRNLVHWAYMSWWYTEEELEAQAQAKYWSQSFISPWSETSPPYAELADEFGTVYVNEEGSPLGVHVPGYDYSTGRSYHYVTRVLIDAVAVAEVYVNGVLVATASMPFVVTYGSDPPTSPEHPGSQG